MEDFHCKGEWWFPGNDENRLPGILSFSHETGATLELTGIFERDKFRNDLEHPKILLGFSQEGHQITLHKLIRRNLPLPFIGLGQTNFFSHFVFDGVHFQNESEIMFHRLQGSFNDLDAWVDANGFKTDWKFGKDGKGITKIVIEYKPPKPRIIDLKDGFRAGVVTSWKSSGIQVAQREANISQLTLLTAESTNGEKTFDELHSVLNRFADLVQIAAQRVITPISIKGFTNHNAYKPSAERSLFYPEVTIYYQPIEKLPEGRPVLPHDMLFKFSELKAKHIRRWFSSYKTHSANIHLYRTLISNRPSFVETRFLNITQALESLHSLMFNKFHLPPHIFKSRKRRVVSVAPNGLRQWLEETIGNSNYKRLKQKLTELFAKRGNLFSPVISNYEQFATRVRDTRNELVHQTKQQHSFDVKEDLPYVITLLKLLFEAYMLDLIGISEVQISKIYEKRIREYVNWRESNQQPSQF